MKKVVRTVWISLLSGLAFLVACTSGKGLSRAEKKQLKQERTAIITQIDQQRLESQRIEDPGVVMSYRAGEMQLRRRLSEINGLLGDEKALAENDQRMSNLVTEMDSLQMVMNSGHEPIPLLYGPPPGERRRELVKQLDQLMEAIQRREGACVYGSPEIIRQYGEETQRMRQQAAELQQQINELDNGSRRK